MSVRRLVLLALALTACAAAWAQTAPRRAAPRPAAPRAVTAVPADTAAADTLQPRAPARPPTPVEATQARLTAAVTAGLAPSGPFPALDARFAGVAWTPPEAPARALDDLIAMRRAGVRAVRTGLLSDTLLLAAASRLGIALYQDLPVEGLPAADLVARTDSSMVLLEAALALGQRYPAARHFGLATACDTSDPRARPYFERLTAMAHAAGATAYFETRFPNSDQVSGSVDLVLVEGTDGPVEALAAWRARSQTPVGLSGVGAAVVPARDGGWRTVGSADAQARALEDALTALLSANAPPAVTFVGAWRDADAPRDARARVSGDRDGLHGADGTARPALAVAAGFFTGVQRVFAFDAGSDRDASAIRGASGLLLLGWVLAVGLGVFMVGVPRLATLLPRYFTRHDLYREAVQRGYDLSAGQTAVVGLGLAVAFGVAMSSALRALGRTDALVAATAAWPNAAQERLVVLLGHPFVLVGVLALIGVAWGLLNVIWLNVLAGRRRLRAAQAMSLVVWSRWMWALLMVAALLLAGLGPQTATALAPALLGVGALVEVVASYRMLLDFASVARVPAPRALGLGFAVPFLVVAAALVWLSLAAAPEAAFVWHLATRG